MARLASVSVDLDSLGCYAAIHGLAPQAAPAQDADPIFRLAVPRLLALLEEAGLRATLFVVGQDLLASPWVRRLLEEAARRGHELGNHSHTHPYNLRTLAPGRRQQEIAAAGEVISAAQGRPVAGFRTPGYNLDASLLQEVARQGYRYDSSLLPCPPYYAAKAAVMAARWAQGEPSRSQLTRLATLRTPLGPYRAALRAPWRRARGQAASLPELPMAVLPGLRFPLIGTSLHLLGARGFEALGPLLDLTHPDFFQLELHAIDLLGAEDVGVPAAFAARQPDLRVPWAAKEALWRAVFAALSARRRVVTLERAAEILFAS